MFRDSYAGAQGRQWLQPHILWWILTFLRANDVRVEWNTLGSPALADAVSTLGLPAGHSDVHPTGQTRMNFSLWWPILTELARMAYRPSYRWRWWGHRLPNARQIEDRAARLGLRPWMSSATFEEISGIGRALARIQDHHRPRPIDPDDFMVRILLPELLITELHWLHAPGGRPRTGNHIHLDVVLLRRYDNALAKHTQGNYLTPLDHMYLRAGDIIHHLSSQPEPSVNPLLRSITDLYDELQRARDEPRSTTTRPEHRQTLRTRRRGNRTRQSR